MNKQFLSILFCILLLFISLGIIPAYAKKPPWAGGPGGPQDYNPPPSAPEPISMILIGMGVSGVAGYYLGKRRKK